MQYSPSRSFVNEKEAKVDHGLPEAMATYFDRDAAATYGTPLLPLLQRAYGGDLRFPGAPAERPYTFANFVQGMDGVVSFQEPGAMSGGAVSGFNAQDQMLMAILRAEADAVMVGAGTLRAEPEHRWIPEHISPKAETLWAELRAALGKRPHLINAFVTGSGHINLGAVVFRQPNIHAVVFTTERGAAAIAVARASHPDAKLDVEVLGDGDVDLPRMLRSLRTTHGVEHLLVEGGPQLMGDFVATGLMDEIFLTDAPQVIGNEGGKRPTWAKGHLFTPETAKWYSLVSVKGWGDYLFRRYRKN